MLMLLANIPDYDEELRRLSSLEKIDPFQSLTDVLGNIFGSELPPEFSVFLKLLIWGCIAAIIIWVLYREFFIHRNGDSSDVEDIDIPEGGLQGTAEDADIRGHNFAVELQQALAAQNYALAVRLRYLITLRDLDSQKLIKWTDWKTPMMYVDELQQDSNLLRQITVTFLYIKYGHYPATKETYDEVTGIYNVLFMTRKGGEA